MKTIFSTLAVLVSGAVIIASSLALRAADDETGFKSIFNGTDLNGWDGNPKFWSVKDGTITGQTTAENPTKGNTFLIWKGGTVDNFELRLSFKIVPNGTKGFGNSGIQYRSKDRGNWVINGYQADFEAGTTYSGILYEEGGRGILAQRGQMTWIQPDGKIRVVGSVGKSEDIQAMIKKEDWNDYVVLARGNHLTHIINGRVTVDVVDDQADKAAKSGILALQLHQGDPMTVQFKNLRLKSLGAKETAASDLEKFKGTWAAAEIIMNGEKVDKDQLDAVETTFTDKTYRSVWSGGGDSGTFSLNDSGNLKSLDLVNEKGEKIPAIYEFTSDGLRACYGLNGAPRPSDYTAPADSQRLFVAYRKK
ncbi:MAG: DUF1080 domain-containing protein [Verrucomicrobia bacterium]|nr:DUF1080 domain-containing protein [Verrucomicrobiota bacterium]